MLNLLVIETIQRLCTFWKWSRHCYESLRKVLHGSVSPNNSKHNKIWAQQGVSHYYIINTNQKGLCLVTCSSIFQISSLPMVVIVWLASLFTVLSLGVHTCISMLLLCCYYLCMQCNNILYPMSFTLKRGGGGGREGF